MSRWIYAPMDDSQFAFSMFLRALALAGVARFVWFLWQGARRDWDECIMADWPAMKKQLQR